MRYKVLVLVGMLSLPVLGSTVTYTDASAWAAAAVLEPNVVIENETFSDNQIQTPELSIETHSGMGSVSQPGNGVIANDMWNDCVGKNGCNSLAYDTTVFSFSKPVYAFGGDWSMPEGSGLEIYAGNSTVISPNQSVEQGHLEGTAFSGFFGFVSDTPFTSVLFASSTGQQSFTVSDAVIGIDPPPATAAPEPSTLAILGVAGIVLGVARKRFRK